MEYSFQSIYLCVVDKKEQILVAAMELLIENGVQATPMSAVAKAAGAGMGTIYNYFPTKEELINAIYLYIKRHEVSIISQPFVSNAIKKQFEQFYAGMLQYLVAYPKHFKFMDQFHVSPIITDSTRNEGMKVFAPYLEVLHTGQEQGIIKNISIEELMQFINGGLMGFARWIITTNKQLTPQLIENQLRIAWDAIKE